MVISGICACTAVHAVSAATNIIMMTSVRFITSCEVCRIVSYPILNFHLEAEREDSNPLSHAVVSAIRQPAKPFQSLDGSLRISAERCYEGASTEETVTKSIL